MTRAFLALILTTAPALAQQQPCGPTGPFEKSLTKQYGEVPVVASITGQGFPMLIFANPKTGTFSVTVRRPGKITCIVQAGKDWTPIEQTKEGQDL